MNKLFGLIVFTIIVERATALTVTAVNPAVSTTEGNMLPMDVTVTGNSGAETGDWYLTDLNGVERKIESSSTHIVTGASLIILTAAESDVGYYVYRVTDGGITAENEPIRVSLSDKVPSVGTTMTTLDVTFGQTAVLHCDFLPQTLLQITDVRWQKTDVNGVQTYIDTSQTSKYNDGTYETPSLTIYDVQSSDLGSYTCQVQNSVGYGSSTAIIVQEQGGSDVITTEQETSTLREITSPPEISQLTTTATTTTYSTEVSLSTQEISTTEYIPTIEPSSFVSTTTKYASTTQGETHLTITETTSADTSTVFKVTTESLLTSPSDHHHSTNNNEPSPPSQPNDTYSTTQTVAEEWCPCNCEYKTRLDFWAAQNLTNYSMDELRIILKPVLDQLDKDLRIDKKNLSSTIRSLTSASDNRPSAVQIGSAGIVFLVLIVSSILIADFSSLRQHAQTCKAIGKCKCLQ